MRSQSTVLSTRGTVHSAIEVIEQGGVRYLRFGLSGGWQGALAPDYPERIIFPYQRAFASLVDSLASLQKFFALGVGAGTCLRTIRAKFPECEQYAVEIDETIIDVAIQYFDSPAHDAVNYWVGDGVTFLARRQCRFDLIFVDAYMRNQIYSACLEPNFAAVLEDVVTESGVVVFNLITALPPQGAIDVFLSAVQNHFPVVHLLPVGIPWSEQNTLAVFSRRIETLSAWPDVISRSAHLGWLQRATWPSRVTSLSR